MNLIQTRGSRHWRENISSMTMPDISITSVEINGSLAYVNYSIEAVEGGYTSLTLVAKKSSAPTSKTDGVTATITQSSTGKLLYLNNSSTYYFAIFAEYNGYTFRTPVVSYNTQSEITFVDTEIRDGIMYNKITGDTWTKRYGTEQDPGYDSANNAVILKSDGSHWYYMTVPGKWGTNMDIRLKASSITIEVDVKLTTSSYNQMSTLSPIIQLRLAGSSPAVKLAQNTSAYTLNWTPPLNSKLNAFHKVKIVVYYRNNGYAYKCELYVDGTLYQSSTFNNVSDTEGAYSLTASCGGSTLVTMYYKSAKVTAVYND